MIATNLLPQLLKLLQAGADENRLRILRCLHARPACVCELVQATGIPQPRVSRHLRILRDAGLVADRRDAQWVEYSLVEPAPGSPEDRLLAFVLDGLAEDAAVAEDLARLAVASREQCETC